jgi:hypothetical protein
MITQIFLPINFITLHFITSDYGEVTRTKRIPGPVADEASSYYEITDCGE